MDEAAVLKRYVETGEQEVFARLVRGHVDLVYAAARRQVRDPGAAEDVTQAVFILLAKKAKGIAPGLLAGWLLRASCLACRDWRKMQARRQRHEQEAAAMREPMQASVEPEWESYAGLIDGAMARLREGERAAVALRYLRGMEWREVGEAMGVSEEAARKRGDRGLARLREIMGAKAAVPSVVALGVMLAAKGVEAAPTGVAEGAIAVGMGTGGTAASAAIAKGLMKMIVWTKVKVAAGVVGGLVLVGGGMVVAQKTMGPTSPRATAPAVQTRATVTSSDWRTRFEVVYRLDEGQVLKCIAPPFIPERLEYYRSENKVQAQAVPAGPNGMCLVWNGKTLRWREMRFGAGYDLLSVMEDVLRIPNYRYQGREPVLRTLLPVDFTLRADATEEQRVAAFQEILRQRTAGQIRIELQTLDREVIVARGQYQFHELPDSAAGSKIELYSDLAEVKDPIHCGDGGAGDMSEFLEAMGLRLGRHVIDETDAIRPQPFLKWQPYRSSYLSRDPEDKQREDKTNVLLDLVSQQTDLTFTREHRKMPIWVFSEGK